MLKIFLCVLISFWFTSKDTCSRSLKSQFIERSLNLSIPDRRHIEQYVTFGHPFSLRPILFKILNTRELLEKRGFSVGLSTVNEGIHKSGGLKELARRYLLWLNSPFNSFPDQSRRDKSDDSLYAEARKDTQYKEKTIRDSIYRATYDLKKWADSSADHPEFTYTGFVPSSNEVIVDTKIPVLFLYTHTPFLHHKSEIVVTTYSFMITMLEVLEDKREKPEFQYLYDLVKSIIEGPFFFQ